MKNIFRFILPAGMLCCIANAAPYVLPAHQPGALTPYDMQPVYAIEALYGIAKENDAPDVWGPRLRFNLFSDAADTVRQQFSLNVAGLWGDKSHHHDLYHGKTDLFILPLTAGYDVNIALGEQVLLYVGGKAGYAWANIKEHGWDVDRYDSHTHNTGGFTCSVGIGFRYMPTDTLYLSAGYEYASTNLSTHHDSPMDGDFGQHVISLGIGTQF